MNRIAALALAMILIGCAAREQVIVVASEDDLRRGLRIDQVEQILGKPLGSATSTSRHGRTDVREYISLKTKRYYKITYWDGRVETLTWVDATSAIAKARKKGKKELRAGQSKAEIQAAYGAPDKVTGTEFLTYW